MEIPQLRYLERDEFSDLKLEDPEVFFSIAKRIIQDIELACFLTARLGNQGGISNTVTETAIRTIYYVDSDFDPGSLSNELTDLFVNPNLVEQFSRSGLAHAVGSIPMVAKFINYMLLDLFEKAAAEAREEDSNVIKTSHLFKACDTFPYPLNIYLC